MGLLQANIHNIALEYHKEPHYLQLFIDMYSCYTHISSDHDIVVKCINYFQFSFSNAGEEGKFVTFFILWYMEKKPLLATFSIKLIAYYYLKTFCQVSGLLLESAKHDIWQCLWSLYLLFLVLAIKKI